MAVRTCCAGLALVAGANGFVPPGLAPASILAGPRRGRVLAAAATATAGGGTDTSGCPIAARSLAGSVLPLATTGPLYNKLLAHIELGTAATEAAAADSAVAEASECAYKDYTLVVVPRVVPDDGGAAGGTQQVLLGKKKGTGFGAGKWNGFGGT